MRTWKIRLIHFCAAINVCCAVLCMWFAIDTYRRVQETQRTIDETNREIERTRQEIEFLDSLRAKMKGKGQ